MKGGGSEPPYYLSRVKDRDSFLAFIQALADEVALKRENLDPYGPELDEPEQKTLESFLNAALAWVMKSQRQRLGLPETPSWKTFASFLFNSKTYEELGRY
jgi:hypothetical protein